MFIKVLPPSKIKVKKGDTAATFYLVQDIWNDFSFQTLYHLYLSAQYSTDEEPVRIGSLKILRKGQSESDGIQVDVGPLDLLDGSYCSLGQTLDYYERLSRLDDNLKMRLFNSLRDVVITPEFKKGFEQEPGWKTSLFRDISPDDDIFTLAPIIVSKEFGEIPNLEFSFNFVTEGMEQPLVFDFDSPKYGHGKKLPSRILVLVGRNASGKSTLLSKISRIAFASGPDRKDTSLRKIGKFEPEKIGFPKIISISYSAFDSFQVPGIYLSEKEQIAKDISRNHGRYIFCGIRDICQELNTVKEQLEVDSRGKLAEKEILRERQPYTLLKPIEEIVSEYRKLIKIITKNNKDDLFREVFNILSKEASFRQMDIMSFPRDNTFLESSFLDLSTGHKFVLHSLANIVAHTEPRSLILFDEPESHLHPPLLAVLMGGIRHVLNKKDAFAVIATHSPVVVQETLRRHVHVLRRDGEITKIQTPEIQTYGENIGTITSHVFGLSTDITDFYYEIDQVIEHQLTFDVRNGNVEKLLSNIKEMFDGDVSVQVRAYIMSKILKKQG